MKSERALQTYLFTQAKAHNVFARKMAAVGRRGFPDVLIATGGEVVFIELKSPTGRGRLSELQKREIERMKSHGLTVHVINNKEEIDDVIQRLTHTSTGRSGHATV